MTTRQRYFLLGLLVFLGTLLALAPAALLTRAIAAGNTLELTQSRGTLWFGTAELGYKGRAIGQVSWRLQPTRLLHLSLTYAIEVVAAGHQFKGVLRRTLSTTELQGEAVIRQATIAPVLQRYDLFIPGAITLGHLDLRLLDRAGSPPRLLHLKGELHWNGGTVRYLLSGRRYETRLPALVGYIDSDNGIPEMTSYAENDDTPLILARVKPDGWLTLGITRAFTRLTALPWPGSEADHTVVLEVEEKVF